MHWSHSHQGTEYRAEFLRGEYLKLLSLLRHANPRLKYPPRVLNDDADGGRQVVRRHGVQIENLLEAITGKCRPLIWFTDTCPTNVQYPAEWRRRALLHAQSERGRTHCASAIKACLSLNLGFTMQLDTVS